MTPAWVRWSVGTYHLFHGEDVVGWITRMGDSGVWSGRVWLIDGQWSTGVEIRGAISVRHVQERAMDTYTGLLNQQLERSLGGEYK